jgi:hypothetical protein
MTLYTAHIISIFIITKPLSTTVPPDQPKKEKIAMLKTKTVKKKKVHAKRKIITIKAAVPPRNRGPRK